MTEKQTKKELEKMRRDLERCGGNCRNCPRLHCYGGEMQTADGRRGYAIAWGCDMFESDIFTSLANSARELHAVAVEAVAWELEAIEQRERIRALKTAQEVRA